jgi:hypothetical protein
MATPEDLNANAEFVRLADSFVEVHPAPRRLPRKGRVRSRGWRDSGGLRGPVGRPEGTSLGGRSGTAVGLCGCEGR